MHAVLTSYSRHHHAATLGPIAAQLKTRHGILVSVATKRADQKFDFGFVICRVYGYHGRNVRDLYEYDMKLSGMACDIFGANHAVPFDLVVVLDAADRVCSFLATGHGAERELKRFEAERTMRLHAKRVA